MVDTKKTFTPMPARIIGDKRLSAADLRVLMAVSLHDRMGRNGTGCYASASRLASISNCDIKALSRSIRRLAECGYLVGKRNPLSPRSRVYSVVFNDLDWGVANPSTGSNSAEVHRLTGSGTATKPGEMGSSALRKAETFQQDVEDNISCETINTIREPEIKTSRETAASENLSNCGDRKRLNVGAILADLERNLNAGIALDRSRWLPWLESLIGDDALLDRGDPNYHRAQRLYETWE